jgi:hypothetical protein
MVQTPIFIVASARPRTGKTLLARVLIEYFAAQERPVAGFDVNPDDFKLSDYLPGYTAAARLSDIRGEMALFDQLVMADTTAKVVDLAHGMFDRFFAVMRQVDVAGEARRRGVVPIVLYIADPDDRGRQGYAMLAGRFPDLALVPVLNHAVPQVARYRDRFPPTRIGGDAVNVPALSAVLHSIIGRQGFSFIGYVNKTTDTTAELYNWVRRTFVMICELEVRLLLSDNRRQQPQQLPRSA